MEMNAIIGTTADSNRIATQMNSLSDLDETSVTQSEQLEKRIGKILTLKEDIFKDVKANITKEQQKQKSYYDKT